MASPTLDEFMRVVGPRAREAGASERDIRQYWATTHGAEHIDRNALPTWEAFKPSILQQQPDIPEEDIRSHWEEHYGDFGAREKDQGDVVRGFKESFQQVPQLLGGLEAGVGAVGEKVVGEGGLFTALKKHGLRKYQDIGQEIAREAKPSDSVTEAYDMARAGNPGALVDWLQHTLSYGGGQVLQMLATAGIGYAGGKLLLKPAVEQLTSGLVKRESARLAKEGAQYSAEELTRQAVSNVAGKAGQLGALGATALGMEGGEIFGGLVEKAAQEGRELTGGELAQATGATLAAGGLDLFSDKFGLDLILGKSLARNLVTSRAGHAAAAGTLGAGVEGGPEFTQTLLEEFGKGNDPFSSESIRQAIDAAAVGGATGGAVGTISGVLRRPEGRDNLTVTERAPPERLALPAPPIYASGPIYTPTGPVEEVIPGKGRLAGLGRGNLETSGGEVIPEQGPRRLEAPLQAGEVRGGTIYAGGPVMDVSPLPDTSQIKNAKDLDTAIVGALEVVHAPTERAKAAAAEGATRQAQAKTDAERAIAAGPETRTDVELPLFTGSTSAEPVVAGQLSPSIPDQLAPSRQDTDASMRQRLAEERARMVAAREQRRMDGQLNPVSEPVALIPAAPPADEGPLPSQLDLAYPSSKQVRDLIHEKGLHLDTPVFKEILRQTVQKESFTDLTPRDLQTLAERLQRIPAQQQATPQPETSPQVPLPPVEKPDKPYAPVTTIPEAQVPRSELPPEKNAGMLLRAEKAQADMESGLASPQRSLIDFLRSKGGVQDQGGELSVLDAGSKRHLFQRNLIQANGMTLDEAAELAHEAGLIKERDLGLLLDQIDRELRGIGQAPDWYVALTEGPRAPFKDSAGQTAHEKIEAAIQKIITDEGKDRGQAVEQVKAAILQDREFHQTEWGRDLNSILEGDWPSWIEKPKGVTQPLERAEPFHNVPRGTPQIPTGEVPKSIKVPPSRTERLAREKQKEAKRAELTPAIGEMAATSYGDLVRALERGAEARRRLHDLPPAQAQEATGFVESGMKPTDGNIKKWLASNGTSGYVAPTIEQIQAHYKDALAAKLEMDASRELNERERAGDPYSPRSQPKPSPPKAPGTELQSATAPPERELARPPVEAAPKTVPPETIGARPIIGREAQPEEAPLSSKAAQMPDVEQADLPVSQEKEPWQMTREAYSSQREQAYIKKRGGAVPVSTAANVNMAADTQHERLVREAVADGEPVPPEVLADYPDLRAQAARMAGPAAQSIAPDIAPAQSEPAQSPSAAQSPTDILASALRQAADQIDGTRLPPDRTNIQDVGEKMGGARKDLAKKTGPRTEQPNPKPEGPAWARRYQVSQIVKSVTPGEEGKWVILDTRKLDWSDRPTRIGKPFATEEEALAMRLAVVAAKTYGVYRSADGTWSIKKLSNNKLIDAVNQQFGTEEEAKRYLAQHAAEILEARTFFGEEVLPRPETVERIGTERRNGRNVDANDFKETFGFRAVEFGNWQNQNERQDLMNHAYDGLHDLADILKIPPRAIGLNGELALAFGSRGHGLSGAAAHYDPDYGVINLTKMQGAGNLAHEWFHAADHYFGRQDTKASSKKELNKRGDLVYTTQGTERDFASYGFSGGRSQVRQEVREAYQALIGAMHRKGERFVEDAQQADRFVAEARQRVAEQLGAIRNSSYDGLSVTKTYGTRHTAPATAEQLAEFDAIAQRILEGETFEERLQASDMAKKSRRYIMAGRWTNDALEQISAIYKAVRGRSGFGSGDQRGALDDLRVSMNFYKQRLKLLADAQAGTEHTKQVPTSFAMDAKSMDQGRAKAYWATEDEMAARAFAAYVEDRLKADGKKSDFITYRTHGAIPTIWGWKKPYPEGAEREAINRAFDTFIDVLQTKETDTGTALYEPRPSYGSHAPTFFSPAMRVLEDKMPNRASAEQIRNILKSAKPDEIKWTGLDDFIQTKESFTKQEVLDYLKANEVQIWEVTLSDDASIEWSALQLSDGSWRVRKNGKDIKTVTARNERDAIDQVKRYLDLAHTLSDYPHLQQNRRPEFSAYQLPGGTDYRELLLMLSGDPANETADRTAFRSSHWSEPNVLAHVRFNTRTVDGKKVLFLEEVQSDWAAKGRREGFNDLTPEETSRWKELDRIASQERILTTQEQAEYDVLDKRYGREGKPGVPNAPFVGKTDSWVGLALKRMLRYAAENGYDSLAWTPGSVQAERYDLSKQVEQIQWEQRRGAKDGVRMVEIVLKEHNNPIKFDALPDGKVYTRGYSISSELEGKTLSDVVGKDVADKILGQDAGVLSGEGLRVGGEGMKGFYDQIVPAFLKKYGKKWGATVGTMELGGVNQDAAPVFDKDTGKDVYPTMEVHAMPITDSMRESVLTEGQSLFENSPRYAVRPGEQPQRNVDLARQALGDLDRASQTVSTAGGAIPLRPPIGSRTVGLGISPDLVHQGVVDLRGYTVASAEDLATLAQVYRNPLFETFRIFYVKGGKIVGHEGITSRLPGVVKVGVTPGGLPPLIREWEGRKQALGATGYYLLHNHPSGNSRPSSEDVAITDRIRSLMPGFKGHVVIDSNEFSTIRADRDGSLGVSRQDKNFGEDRLLSPSVQHPLLGELVSDYHAVARIGKSIQAPQGFATVIYRGGAEGRTRAIQEVSAEFLADAERAKPYLQQQADAFGAVEALVHYSAQNGDQVADKLARSMDHLIEQGVVLDYATSRGEAVTASRRESRGFPPSRTMAMGRAYKDIATHTVEEGRGAYETGTIDPPVARERLKEAKASLRPYLLGALGLEQISQVYGDDHPDVRTYNEAVQRMEADFTGLTRDSDAIARAWTKLKIPVADEMAQVMEDARFLDFDPDPKRRQAADSEKKRALVEKFGRLPDDAKAVYRNAREYYTKLSSMRFEALKDRIEREGGTQKDIDELNVAYTSELKNIYFPFSRFGEYVVIAKKLEGGKEVGRDVQQFESVRDAAKFAQLLKLNGWQVKQTVAKEYSREHDGSASKVVDAMKEIIERLDTSPRLLGNKDVLLDALNQSYLQSMPSLSYSKHFLHAKNVKGASRDALRAFAHSALHGSHHISRLRHADTVTNALTSLDDTINETADGDSQEARQVYNELTKRHDEYIMNPNTHPVSAWLGQLGFVMSLGGVVATGITNATQVPLVTLPWLGARYGFGKASAALARAYKDFLDPRTLNTESLFDATQSPWVSESERKMLRELARRGLIDLTQTMDLAGLSSRDNLSRRARLTGSLSDKITRMLGFTFHAPEVMNRQVTALAAFRLEMKKEGASFEQALERAKQAIDDTHFIYQAFNRPRYMSGNFLRVLTMFKQYPQNIAFLYGKAAAMWLDRNNVQGEERTIAKRQLVSMLVLQFGAAGALGMPFFGSVIDLLMTAVGAFGDDDDKREWEVAVRKWLDGTATSLADAFLDDKDTAEKIGSKAAEVVSHGVSRLTPWDMAARLGQQDLFFRDPQREREGRQAALERLVSVGGPVPSYAVNLLMGYDDVKKGVRELNAGHFLRGVEELTPAVLRNGIKALRYTLEGVRTRNEYKQLDLTTSEQLGQALGFTPSNVAEMYESTTAVKNKEHRIMQAQQSLKDRFARAVADQDDDAKQRILEDIQAFNARHPIFAITSDTLNRSLKARRQHEAGMERGMYLPPKRRALLEEGDFGDF